MTVRNRGVSGAVTPTSDKKTRKSSHFRTSTPLIEAGKSSPYSKAVAIDMGGFAAVDSNLSTRTPLSLAAALRELEAAGDAVSRALFAGGPAEREAADSRLTRAIARVQFEATQHLGQARAR